MWKNIQAIMRKYRLQFGRYIWDRKEEKEKIEEGNFIENNHVKSILFLRQDGKVGDMVVHSIIFREMKRKYPYIKIGVITKGAAGEIIKNNPNIDKIYHFKKEKKEIQKMAASIAAEKYDVLVDFSIMLRVRDMMLISLCKARYNVGVNREAWKIFDLSIPFAFKSHITDLYVTFLERMGIESESRNYEIFNETSILKAQNKIIVLNPYASNRHRSFSDDMTVKIGKEISKYDNVDIYIVGEESRSEDLENIAKNIGTTAKYYRTKGILDLVSLIQGADLIVSPDTAAVHIGSAFQKQIISVYLEDNEEILYAKMWAPNSKYAKIIYSDHSNMDLFSWKTMEEYLKEVLE